VHGYNDQNLEALGDAILAYSADRLKLDPVPLDGPRTLAELDAAAGTTITAKGIGGLAALKLFEEDLAPACISTDHPRYLSFIPCAPTGLCTCAASPRMKARPLRKPSATRW
jgi:hypothetical protein